MNRKIFAGIRAGLAWVVKVGLWVGLAASLAACVMPDGTVVNSWPPVFTHPASAAKPTPVKPSPADPWIEEGKLAGRQNDLTTALADFNKAVAADPANASAYYYRGLAYHLQGNDQAALADLNQALTLAPDSLAAASLRAEVRGSLGDYQGMADDETRALALLPPDQTLTAAEKLVRHAQLYDGRSTANKFLKEPEAEVADLEAYLALNPWDAKAFLELRQRRQALAAYDASLAQYEKSASTPSTKAEIAYDQGMRDLLQGLLLGYPDEVITATEAFSATIAADPSLAAAYHKRAVAELAVAGGGDQVTGMQMNGNSGIVERIDAATGNPYTQTAEAYQAEANAAAAQNSQIAAKAAGDLQQALKLDPSLAEAANDLAVLYNLNGIGESTPMTDALGVAGALFGMNPPDEAHQHGQAAALPLFDQAVQAAPEWIVARRNRAMANLMEGIRLANSDNAQDVQKALAPTQIAKADADYIISHAADDDNDDGWPYYIRLLATTIIAKLNGGEADKAQTDADGDQFHLRTPNVNYDFRLQEAATQLRLSLSAPPVKPILDGHLEISGTEMILVNDTLGVTLTVPPQAPDHLFASVDITGAHYVALHDDFRVIDIVALDATPGAGGMEEWLNTNFLPFYPDAKIQPNPLRTKNGTATLVELGDQHFAFLPAGGRIYSVAYQVAADSSFADGYGIDIFPVNKVLRDIIERFSFDNQE